MFTLFRHICSNIVRLDLDAANEYVNPALPEQAVPLSPYSPKVPQHNRRYSEAESEEDRPVNLRGLSFVESANPFCPSR